jgi:hypothetical protein
MSKELSLPLDGAAAAASAGTLTSGVQAIELDQIEEGTEQDHDHLPMPEVNAEFIEEVRNFLLSTN